MIEIKTFKRTVPLPKKLSEVLNTKSGLNPEGPGRINSLFTEKIIVLYSPDITSEELKNHLGILHNMAKVRYNEERIHKISKEIDDLS